MRTTHRTDSAGCFRWTRPRKIYILTPNPNSDFVCASRLARVLVPQLTADAGGRVAVEGRIDELVPAPYQDTWHATS